MTLLSLRKVNSFVKVAELRSFRCASDALHISAPALSAHVRELEETLGIPVLHRTTRTVELTPDGARFLTRIRGIITDLEGVVAEFREEAELKRGRVRVACVPTLASGYLPYCVAEYGRRFPKVFVHVRDAAANDVARMVESGEVEIGIGPYPENGQPFDVDFLVEDRFVAVLPAGHRLARRRAVRLKDLAREPFIALQTGHSVRSTLSRVFGKAGLEFAPIYDLMHHFSIGGMVQAGLGVTALPSMALPLLNQSGLVSVPIVQPSVSRVIGLIRRKGTAPSPAARELHATLTACVATFPGTSGLRRGAGAKAGRS